MSGSVAVTIVAWRGAASERAGEEAITKGDVLGIDFGVLIARVAEEKEQKQAKYQKFFHMAAPAAGVVSTFPNPPIYFKRYSVNPDTKVVEGSPPPPVPSDLPDPLILFGGIIHPPFPTLNEPHVYGLPVEQLYPPKGIDIKEELRKLNRSLLLNFLEVLDVLCTNPTQYQTKIEAIERILANMHHLLNFYRPHQAREYISTVLEEQIKNKKAAIETIQTSLKSVDTILDQLTSQLSAAATRPAPSSSASSQPPSAQSLTTESGAMSTVNRPHENGLGSSSGLEKMTASQQVQALQQLLAQLDALSDPPR